MLIAGSMVKPIIKLAETAQKIADGDLTQTVQVSSLAEIVCHCGSVHVAACCFSVLLAKAVSNNKISLVHLYHR
ncbi:MAG: HAMP domain-containing protein [Negativicutes bacterium]